ncbi:ABC transporter permease [Nesterenkonia sphaerica]|uniref:ABC transporter permease n=1 Tax=Nesterenkonia sphaerica TaxID=1804988 RepID=A0A5R9AN75_9MICC|nr:ABC transporter permease [Nesterenkonia sphaerica]TLP79465.1 ABC transporter permease [Nesterenkonia sphaerica]
MSAPDTEAQRRSQPAAAHRRILAHGLYEARLTLRNGEQLLVSLILPLLVLLGLHRAHAVTDVVPGIDIITPGVLSLAVMASAFTGAAIATGFERQYGVLAYLATTPLGATGLILGKSLAVLCVIAVQVVVLGASGAVLGWSPEPLGILWLAVVLVIGAAAFTALGLLLAGTVRAEATLALANVAWVLMGAAGGAVLPLDHHGAGALLLALPSAALGEAVRGATVDGHLAAVPVLILATWALVAIAAARKWFTWK